MDGVTDAPFRWITDTYGKPEIIYTEFISVKGLILGKPSMQRMLLHHKTETKTIAQFFGIEPEYFYQSALVALEKGYDGVDINMGCPDKSVFHRGAGAGLILQPKLAKDEVAEEVVVTEEQPVIEKLPIVVEEEIVEEPII